MTQIIRQSTAVDVLIGPFVDSTDGYTGEVGVSPAVKLAKNGQALAAKNDATTPVHDADGYYNCELDATDTNTVGTMVLSVVGSATSLAVRHEYQVVEEAVYDSMYAASAAGPLQSTVAGRTLDVSAGGEAGIDWANVGSPTTAVDLSATDIQLCDTTTTNTDMVAAAPTAAANADAVWDELLAGHVTSDSAGELLNDWQDGGRLDLILDARMAEASISTTGGAVDNVTLAATTTTLTNLPSITAGWLTAAGIAASALDGKGDWLSAAAVNAEVDTALVTYGLDHLVQTSVTGTDIADDSIIARVVSASATADWDDYVQTTDSLQAIRDRGDSAWTTGAGGTPPQLLQSTTITGLSSQTVFNLTAGSADDDAYNGAVVVVTDQSTSTQKAVGSVLDYTGATKTITLASDPGIFTMANGDTIDVIANASTAPTAAAVADAVLDEALSGHVAAGSLGKAVADIEVDTGTSLPATLSGLNDVAATDIVSSGAITTSGGAVSNVTLVATTTTNTDMRGTDSASLASVCTEARLSELDAATGGKMANQVDVIQTDTTTDIPATISALNDISAADVNAQVLDVLETDTFAEPAAVPAATASLKDKLGWLFTLSRNKLTQTATTQTLRNDADGADIASSTVSDDATTATRGKFST